MLTQLRGRARRHSLPVLSLYDLWITRPQHRRPAGGPSPHDHVGCRQPGPVAIFMEFPHATGRSGSPRLPRATRGASMSLGGARSSHTPATPGFGIGESKKLTIESLFLVSAPGSGHFVQVGRPSTLDAMLGRRPRMLLSDPAKPAACPDRGPHLGLCRRERRTTDQAPWSRTTGRPIAGAADRRLNVRSCRSRPGRLLRNFTWGQSSQYGYDPDFARTWLLT